MTERERQTLDDVLHLLFGRAARIAIVATLCFAAGLALTQAWGPHYTATVRLMAPPGQAEPGRTARDEAELLHDPICVTRVLPALLAGRSRPNFWDTAAQELGLATPETPAAFAARATRALAVRTAPGTQIIQASFTWADPVFAARALNLIVAAHERTGAASAASLVKTAQAQAHVAALHTELDGLDRQLAGPHAADALRDQRLRLRDQLAASRAAADRTRLDRALAQQHEDAMRQTFQSGGWVEAADADGGAHPLTAGLTALLDRRQQLLLTGQNNSAALRALDREMARAREQAYAAGLLIATNRAASLDDRLAKLAANIADTEAEAAQVDRQIAQAEIVTQARHAKDAELATAQAALAAARTHLEPGWLASEVVSPAVPPQTADWPRQPVLLLLSAIVALAAGLANAARAEARRLTIDRPADLPRLLGIEVLAGLECVRV